MKAPQNLIQHRVVIIPAETPPAEWWAVYRRIDVGDCIHAEYVGFLDRRPGETADELMARAEERLARRD